MLFCSIRQQLYFHSEQRATTNFNLLNLNCARSEDVLARSQIISRHPPFQPLWFQWQHTDERVSCSRNLQITLCIYACRAGVDILAAFLWRGSAFQPTLNATSHFLFSSLKILFIFKAQFSQWEHVGLLFMPAYGYYLIERPSTVNLTLHFAPRPTTTY